MPEQVEAVALKAISSVNGGMAVGANADVALLAHNASRTSFILSNDGAGDAWVSYGAAAAVAHKGHYLAAGGGVLSDDEWSGAVHVFSIAGSNICFIEKSSSVGEHEGEQVAGADEFVPSGPGDAPIGPSAPVVEHR